MQAVSETPCSFNHVYSMMLYTKLSGYLYQMVTGENRVGSKLTGRERDREELINGVRDRVLEGFGNCVHWGKGHLSISNRSDK